MRTRVLLAAALTFMVVFPGAATAQQALPLGSVTRGQMDSAGAAEYMFSADSAGMLTVAVRGQGDVDLIIVVTDSLGQALPDGRVDSDLGGDTGAEQLVATLRSPGEYRVRVETFGSGSGSFDIGASWMSFPSVAVAADPDGLPTAATVLTPGTPINDSIDPAAGDMWDWFVITADAGSVITVVTSAADGDLALEVFNDGAFGEAVNRSDQDLQGVAGNESITVQASAGQRYYFKVSPVFSQGRIEYQIRVGVM